MLAEMLAGMLAEMLAEMLTEMAVSDRFLLSPQQSTRLTWWWAVQF